MIRTNSFLSILAPFAALAILIVTAIVNQRTRSETSDAALHKEKVRNVFALIPGEMGTRQTWVVRKDVPVPSSQARMLDLNAYISKELHLLGSSPPVRITLFLAHSSDARAMAGHHPPNCYPAVGWFETDAPTAAEILAKSGRILDVHVYSFSRGIGLDGIAVVNGFIVPGLGSVARLEEAAVVMNRASRSRFGLAQFQLVFQGPYDLADVLDMATDILSSLPEDLYAALEAQAVIEEFDS